MHKEYRSILTQQTFGKHIWVFPFWSEFEFVKLVHGKSDYQYDFSLLANSST